jgi:hypothetical protein
MPSMRGDLENSEGTTHLSVSILNYAVKWNAWRPPEPRGLPEYGADCIIRAHFSPLNGALRGAGAVADHASHGDGGFVGGAALHRRTGLQARPYFF